MYKSKYNLLPVTEIKDRHKKTATVRADGVYDAGYRARAP